MSSHHQPCRGGREDQQASRDCLKSLLCWGPDSWALHVWGCTCALYLMCALGAQIDAACSSLCRAVFLHWHSSSEMEHPQRDIQVVACPGLPLATLLCSAGADPFSQLERMVIFPLSPNFSPVLHSSLTLGSRWLSDIDTAVGGCPSAALCVSSLQPHTHFGSSSSSCLWF